MLLLYATSTWGLGVSYDSVAYIQASDSLNVELPQPRDQGGEPLYWWAPGYPVALKAVGGGYSAARYLSAFLLLAGALVIGVAAWRPMGRTAGVTAGALYAFSPAVFAAHLELLAEPLYLVLATATLAFVAERRPWLGGLTAAAAVLTRYAGLPLIATGAVVLRGRDRLRFLCVSVPPYVAWLVRNELVAEETTGRRLRWHPPGWDAFGDGARAFGHLLVTSGELGSISLPAGDPGTLLQLGLAATLVVSLLGAKRVRAPAIVTTPLVYAALYCGFLAATITLFDAGTPVNERLLVPVVPAIVLTIAWLVRARPLVAAVLVCLFAVAVAQQARTTSLYGIHYSGRIWRPARLDGVRLPATQLYSNWPGAVAYFTGRSPRRLPEPSDPHTGDRNGDFEEEMVALAEAVRSGRASLVVLDGRRFLELSSNGVAATRLLAELGGACRKATTTVIVCSAGEPSSRVGPRS